MEEDALDFLKHTAKWKDFGFDSGESYSTRFKAVARCGQVCSLSGLHLPGNTSQHRSGKACRSIHTSLASIFHILVHFEHMPPRFYREICVHSWLAPFLQRYTPPVSKIAEATDRVPFPDSASYIQQHARFETRQGGETLAFPRSNHLEGTAPDIRTLSSSFPPPTPPAPISRVHHIYMYIYICVCERDRERKRDIETFLVRQRGGPKWRQSHAVSSVLGNLYQRDTGLHTSSVPPYYCLSVRAKEGEGESFLLGLVRTGYTRNKSCSLRDICYRFRSCLHTFRPGGKPSGYRSLLFRRPAAGTQIMKTSRVAFEASRAGHGLCWTLSPPLSRSRLPSFLSCTVADDGFHTNGSLVFSFRDPFAVRNVRAGRFKSSRDCKAARCTLAADLLCFDGLS